MNCERIKQRKIQENPAKELVVYWMQTAQRLQYNHAFHYAIEQANKRGLPLVVFFGLVPDYPQANARHYWFMLQGLQEVKKNLADMGVAFLCVLQAPPQGMRPLLERCALLVCDQGVTHLEKQWRNEVVEYAPCDVVEIDTNCIVPVTYASNKEEYSAATLRRKIMPLLDDFLDDFDSQTYVGGEYDLGDYSSFAIEHLDATLEGLSLDRSVAVVAQVGGTQSAINQFQTFLEEHFEHYVSNRNDPNQNATSNMSPYLHFGQIGAQHLLVMAKEWSQVHPGCMESYAAFVEELFVRRELAFNFVYYNDHYDQFGALPNWALSTLWEHDKDIRPYHYGVESLEQATTHDPYWNAAQRQLVATGTMPGYLRMYWGKKILEWGLHSKVAFEMALYLNNKYALDGRDPNSFAGIAWCFGKHDRPWTTRPIFGTIRYMNASGLERKFDMKRYVLMVDGLY
ncbi:MAG: deoxyribodipyrimidine photo-lyase [Erysipelotrichaceae bacterium]